MMEESWIDEEINYFKNKISKTTNPVLHERYTMQIELLESLKELRAERKDKDSKDA